MPGFLTTLEELAIRISGLDDAVRAANGEAKNSGLPWDDGEPGNAYRHMLISAEITRRWGPGIAKQLTDGHEEMNELRGEQTDRDLTMDKANNAIGIEIGKSAKSWEDIVRMARGKIEEAAPHGGDGQEGRAQWHPKRSSPDWRPQWSAKPIHTYPKAGPDHRSDNHEGPWNGTLVPGPWKEPETREEPKADESAFQGALWQPDPPGPLDKEVKDWTPQDAAKALLDKDYGRPDRMDGPELVQRVGDYYRRPDAGDVSRVVTAELEARREAVPPTPGGLEAFRSALVRKDPGDAALKPLADWTPAEAREVMRTYVALPDRDPRKTQLADRTAKWFGRVYGDGPVARDETGRNLDPEPLVPPPQRRSPILTADGQPLEEGLLHMGRKVAENAGMDPAKLGPALKAMQGGLNLMNGAGASPKAIAEDGIMGPETRGALKKALVEEGTPKVERAYALGQLRDYARAGRDEGFADLAEVTRTSLGGLHPDPETGLQKTLNALGSRAGSWEPLKEDGWIGPKTTGGFSRVASATPADDMVRSWAASLWEDWA